MCRWADNRVRHDPGWRSRRDRSCDQRGPVSRPGRGRAAVQFHRRCVRRRCYGDRSRGCTGDRTRRCSWCGHLDIAWAGRLLWPYLPFPMGWRYVGRHIAGRRRCHCDFGGLVVTWRKHLGWSSGRQGLAKRWPWHDCTARSLPTPTRRSSPPNHPGRTLANELPSILDVLYEKDLGND